MISRENDCILCGKRPVKHCNTERRAARFRSAVPTQEIAHVLWCNYSGDDDTGYKIDKSYNQIKAAIDNGVMPVMVRDTSDDWRTEIPNTVDIWGRDYFSMTWLVAYTTENDGPGYRVNFGEGWTFISTDADADMDVD